LLSISLAPADPGRFYGRTDPPYPEPGCRVSHPQSTNGFRNLLLGSTLKRCAFLARSFLSNHDSTSFLKLARLPAGKMVKVYNGRGDVKNRIKEGKNTLRRDKTSYQRFEADQARLKRRCWPGVLKLTHSAASRVKGAGMLNLLEKLLCPACRLTNSSKFVLSCLPRDSLAAR
jgi:hypothetical protein